MGEIAEIPSPGVPLTFGVAGEPAAIKDRMKLAPAQSDDLNTYVKRAFIGVKFAGVLALHGEVRICRRGTLAWPIFRLKVIAIICASALRPTRCLALIARRSR